MSNAAMRVILITGKGGVGKSSVAAATALSTARRGYRTALISIDAAHNLGDILAPAQRRVGPHLTTVATNLDAIEVNINREIRERWSAVIEFFRFLSSNHPTVNSIVAEEVAVLPGMEEIFGLLRLQQIAAAGQHEVIVVDAPPTGDAMKFLRLPEVLDWFMQHYLPMERAVVRRARPLAQRLNIPIPDEMTVAEVDNWFEEVRELSDWLTNPRQVTARLVTTPDRVSLAETRRALSAISLFGIRVDALIVNKIFPTGGTDPFLSAWSKQQGEVLAQIEHDFESLPRFEARYQPFEILGLERLERFASEMYGETAPEAVLVEQPVLDLEERGDEIALKLWLPFLQRDQFKLHVGVDALYIQVQTQRRQIPLPASLLDRRFLGASYDQGTLRVRFSQQRQPLGMAGAESPHNE
jgi:arsenite-transporting ATPase